MKTLLVEVHIDGENEVRTETEYGTKYEAERIADIRNENRHYDYVDKHGKRQALFFYVIPKRYQKA